MPTKRQIAVRVDAETVEALERFRHHKRLQIGEMPSLAMIIRILLRDGLRDYMGIINAPRIEIRMPNTADAETRHVGTETA